MIRSVAVFVLLRGAAEARSMATNAGPSHTDLPRKGADMPVCGLLSGKRAAQEIKERLPVLPAIGGTCRNFGKLEMDSPNLLEDTASLKSWFARVTHKSHLSTLPCLVTATLKSFQEIRPLES